MVVFFRRGCQIVGYILYDVRSEILLATCLTKGRATVSKHFALLWRRERDGRTLLTTSASMSTAGLIGREKMKTIRCVAFLSCDLDWCVYAIHTKVMECS